MKNLSNVFKSLSVKKVFLALFGFAIAIFCVSFVAIPAGLLGAAIFIPSTNIGEIRGSAGSTTYSKNHSGNYFKQKIMPIIQYTADQLTARAFITTFSKLWKSLTESARNGFDNLASQLIKSNRLGQSYTLTGEQLYIQLNSNLSAIGQPAITTAPNPINNTVPTQLVVGCTADSTPGSEDLTVTFGLPIGAGQSMLIYASKPVSQGIKRAPSMKIVKVATASFTTNTSIKNEYIAKIGALPQTGEKVFISFKMIDNNTGFYGGVNTASAIATV